MSERDNRAVPPPVEGLSDIAWQRVEKNLFAALDCDASVPTMKPYVPQRRWAPWLVGGGLALAGAAAALVLLMLTDPAAPPPVAGGELDAGGHSPARVVTQDSPSQVSFGDATITVDADSALTMHGDRDRGVLIVLERGSAMFEVAPRNGHPVFQVMAGEVTVRVIGTRFSVQRSGDHARVAVIEGHVEVVARGRRVDVRAGETWSSDGDWEAAVRGQATTPDAVAAAPLLDGRPWEGSSSADGAADEETRQRPRQRSSRADDRDRFEQAAALEPTNAREALRQYKKLAAGGGKWAGPSLFAAGRLAAELGQKKTARKLLDRYLKRHPDGGNAADARALLATLGE